MIEDLIKYFKETPREQILKDWEESKELDKIGISALEYISKIDFLDTKIDDCDLSIRTKNICRMNDIKVIRDLIAYRTKDLMMLHFGKRTISEIQELLISKGYSFGS
jgi:DNA-directed RNA polymerase alpha subunit